MGVRILVAERLAKDQKQFVGVPRPRKVAEDSAVSGQGARHSGVRVGGEEQPGNKRVLTSDAAEQVYAAHVGQRVIRQHELNRLVAQDGQRFLAGGGTHDAVFPMEYVVKALQDVGLATAGSGQDEKSSRATRGNSRRTRRSRSTPPMSASG